MFGSSTPLYVLWLTVLRLLLPGDLAAAAVRANAIGFIAAALLAGWLVRRLTDRPLVGAATALALLVNPMLLTLSTGGMESYWFLSLALGAMLVLARDPPRPALFGVLVGLAILTRAEGVLLGPIALLVFARRPRHLLEAAAAAAIPLAAWALFSIALLRLTDPAVDGGEGKADLSAAAAVHPRADRRQPRHLGQRRPLRRLPPRPSGGDRDQSSLPPPPRSHCCRRHDGAAPGCRS